MGTVKRIFSVLLLVFLVTSLAGAASACDDDDCGNDDCGDHGDCWDHGDWNRCDRDCGDHDWNRCDRDCGDDEDC